MSDDNDIICEPAPVAAPPEEPAKTMIINRDGGGAMKIALIAIGLVLALIAGVTYAVMHRSGGAASAEVTTGGGSAAETVATATGSGDAPAECAGDLSGDAQQRWNCTEWFPFVTKVAADHDRLDRLEAKKERSGVPTGLWLLVIGIGLLTVYNTVRIHSKPADKPPNG